MKTAIIGGGRIAREHLSSLKEIKQVRIEAICDLSGCMAEAFAECYGIPYHFTDHRKMLAEIRPEVVHVLTPPGTHFSIAWDCLAAGAHVVVEKPMASDENEVALLLKFARERGLCIIEDYNYLFNFAVRQIRGLMAEKAFGDLVHVGISIQLDLRTQAQNVFGVSWGARGIIADFLTHMAALATCLLGPHEAVHTLWMKNEAGEYDEFRALLRCASGTAFLLFSSKAQPNSFCVDINGTRMSARTNLFEPGLILERQGGPRALVPLKNAVYNGRELCRCAFYGLWRKLAGKPCSYEGIPYLLREFYHALGHSTPVPISPEMILEVNKLYFLLQDESHELCVF